MEHETQDAITRLRRKFFIKDNEPVGFGSAIIIKAEHQVTDTERVLEFVATTQDVDLDEEVLLASGADWSYFEGIGCRALYLDHRYSQDNHIGVVRSISPYMRSGSPVGWKMRAHIFTGLKCPNADDVWTKSQQTSLGMSPGFIPMEWGPPDAVERKSWPNAKNMIRKWKAIEVSVTATPCNQMAHTTELQSSKSHTKTVTEIPRRIIEI